MYIDTNTTRVSTAPAETRNPDFVVLSSKLASLVALEDADFDLIASTSSAKSRVIPAGVLLPDGKRLSRSFVVSGWMGRLNLFADGRRQIISTMVTGELVGAHANPLIVNSTVALVNSQICDLTNLLDALERNPSGHLKLREALSMAEVIEEAQMTDQIVRLGKRTAVERMGHWLLDLQHRLSLAGVSRGERFPMPLTQEVLGDVLGMSVVHVSRIVAQLRKERLVDVHGGFVTLLDPDRLRMITEFEPLSRAAAKAAAQGTGVSRGAPLFNAPGPRGEFI